MDRTKRPTLLMALGLICSIRKCGWCLALLSILTAFSCEREEWETPIDGGAKEYKVAIVLPYSDGLQQEWKGAIEWALEKANNALAKENDMKIKAEWYDEDTYNIKELFMRLSTDDDVCAIIGPLYSEDAYIGANICARTGKTLMPALATSEQMMRAYAGKGFLWCLAENDISQCELLLALAKENGAESISLLSSDDLYGQTFTDWFAFQAKEMGLTIVDADVYDDYDVEEKMSRLINGNADCLICVSNGNNATQRMNKIRRLHTNAHTRFLFSDGAYLLSPNTSYDGMEGVVQTYDPNTNFNDAYKKRFGKTPPYGSAHFYDAITLAALAVAAVTDGICDNINDALKYIVDMEGVTVNICDDAGITQAIRALKCGAKTHITGASGELRFIPKQYTNVRHSVYGHWCISQGKHIFDKYFTSDRDSQKANWEWLPTQIQSFGSNTLTYPKLEGLHALIVAGSAGWSNYRHQADALAIYKMLLAYGVNVDDIALVSEMDAMSGVEDLIADYHLSDIDWNTMAKKVLIDNDKYKTDSTGNLFVYWAGHGDRTGLKWLDSSVSPAAITQVFSEMAVQKRFRKALVIIESCYSGIVGKALEGIPGLLCITAANDIETSKASKYSAELSVWTSNSFSDALLDFLVNQTNASIYDLYTETYSRTVGSHVSVYNAERFGNLRNTKVAEFVIPP